MSSKEMFNLQLFNEGIDETEFEGIDEDILKDITDVDEQSEEVPEVSNDTADVEADNDNKQVAEEEAETDNGQSVPYTRFKEVNDERKQLKARIAELEAMQSNVKQEPPAPVEQEKHNVQEQQGNTVNFNADHEKQITQLAVEQAMKAFNLTEEDVANLEYNDDPNLKYGFYAYVANASKTIRTEAVQKYKEAQAFEREQTSIHARFDSEVAEFLKKEDAEARWNFMANQKFAEMTDVNYKSALQRSLSNLKAHKASPQDYYLFKSYFDNCNAEYDGRTGQQQSSAAKIKSVQGKLAKAQSIPKAGRVNGVSGNDGYTQAQIAEILNGPASNWESLPEDIRNKILNGDF